jgi:SAM-dependent methyltransferase
MRIINPKVQEAIDSGAGLRLNLGSGMRPRPGFFGIDHLALPGADIVGDLNEPLSLLPDGCVDEVFSRHALEHVRELLPLMAELHRVCRPNARLEIIVPHFSNPYFYSDPTHVRCFGLYTFFYFSDEDDQPKRKVPAFYAKQRFRVDSVAIELMRRGRIRHPVSVALQWWINRGVPNIDWYERRICRLFPAESIRYVLQAKDVARQSIRQAG